MAGGLSLREQMLVGLRPNRPYTLNPVYGEFTIQVQQLQKKASISDTAKKHQNLAGDRKWIPTVILRPLSGVA